MSIRVAVEEDIPVLVKLAQAGLKDDYVWKYCFPGGITKDSSVVIEETLRQYLRQDKQEWLICVNQEAENNEVVAMALWHLPVGEASEGPGVPESAAFPFPSTAKDNHADDILAAPRVVAIRQADAKAQELVRAKYGRHMFLHAVITHPEWKGLGYAKPLARHGMELARNKDVALAALASPNGYIFYSGLGFKDCGSVNVRVEGQIDDVTLKTMVYNPSHTKDTQAVGWVEWFLGHGQQSHTA